MTAFIKHFKAACICGVLLLLFQGCSVQQHLEADESLLRETKLKNPPSEHTGPLKNLIRQQPNARTFGIFPFRLWFYSGIKKDEPGRIRGWLTDRLGEPPVILDSADMERSAEAMENYLFNKGYFDVAVEPRYHHKSYSSSVEFHFEIRQPYRIQNLERVVANRSIDSLLDLYEHERLLKQGDTYDTEKLNRERVRIENILRNHGYYRFRRDMVYFDVDSTEGNRRVNILTGISDPVEEKQYQQYYIRTVYVNSEYQLDNGPPDTTELDDLIFVSAGEPVRVKNLANLIDIRPGQLYNQERVRRTIRQLNAFGVFQYIDIQFEESEHHATELNAHVRLRPAPKQQISFDSELLTRERSEEGVELFSPERYYGLGANVRYNHRNLARRGLQFETNIGGLLEVQWQDWLTNYQLRGGGSLRFPGLIFPGSLFERIRENPSSTVLNLNYIYENNPNFVRNQGNLSLQYQIEQNNLAHYITPFQASLVSTTAQPAFSDELDNLLERIDDPFIRDFYINLYGSRHLIQGVRYTVIYNTGRMDQTDNFWFIRYNVFETSGNLLSLLNTISGEETEEGRTARFMGIDYYQYFKSDFDIRYNQHLGSDRRLIYRINAGAGYPYGNSEFLPFEKRFFTGGTNSIRAWRVRSLGPGSALDEDAIDRTGDMKLEMNIEYRFPISGIFEGAFFLDGGNVWKWDEQEIAGASFEPEKLLSEIAVGTGTGLRLDFSFFVFRLDLGLRVYDPAPVEKQFIVQDLFRRTYWTDENYNVNFGIGYPF